MALLKSPLVILQIDPLKTMGIDSIIASLSPTGFSRSTQNITTSGFNPMKSTTRYLEITSFMCCRREATPCSKMFHQLDVQIYTNDYSLEIRH